MDFTNSLNLKKEDISSISRKLEKDILSNFQIHNISYGK